MWRTLPPLQLQTVFWEPYFPLKTACYVQLWEKKLININYEFENSSSKLQSAPLISKSAQKTTFCTFLGGFYLIPI